MKPEDALIHYDIGAVRKISPISIGLIHSTYKIKAAAGDFILQQLHPMLSHPSLTEDYAAVTQQLAAAGVTAQSVIKTRDGALTVADESAAERTWRLLSFVPGSVIELMETAGQARACGAAVGQFHAGLAGMKYKFKSTLAFHPYDSAKFYRAFKAVAKKFAHDPLMEPVREEVEFLLRVLPKTALPSGLPKRVVHGDLKITNFVFDAAGKSVRAIIDLDTCAKFPVLYELGDALRSWCGRAEDDPHNKFNAAFYRAAVEGYSAGAPGFLSARERRLLPRALKHITLTQACRFLRDYFEDNYFGWNAKKYSSRRAANLARARGQIAFWKDQEKKLK